MSAESVIFTDNIPTIVGLKIEDFVINTSKTILSCTLVWYNTVSDELMEYYNIYYSTGGVCYQLLGRAYSRRFCVVKLVVNQTVEFYVQPVATGRVTTAVAHSPSITITL